jgi:hypothetical protein
MMNWNLKPPSLSRGTTRGDNDFEEDRDEPGLNFQKSCIKRSRTFGNFEDS